VAQRRDDRGRKLKADPVAVRRSVESMWTKGEKVGHVLCGCNPLHCICVSRERVPNSGGQGNAIMLHAIA